VFRSFLRGQLLSPLRIRGWLIYLPQFVRLLARLTANRLVPLPAKLAWSWDCSFCSHRPRSNSTSSRLSASLTGCWLAISPSNFLSGCAHPANMSAGLRGAVSPANTMRPRNLLLSLAAGIIVALIVLSLADSLLVDLLWFSTLGYRQVFNITISAEVVIFTIVWVVAFLAIWISGMIVVADDAMTVLGSR
jgi:hypothetical protein